MVSSTKSIAREQFEKNKTSWTKSFFEGFSQDENGDAVPWMTYPAIEFLKNHLKLDHEIFEFGCGASTLFFAARVKKVVGIETNARWLSIVEEKLNKGQTPSCDGVTMEDGGVTNSEGDNISFSHAKPSTNVTPPFPLVTPSQDGAQNVKITLMEDGLTNPAYENFAKNYQHKFDLIIIDSLKRFECAKNSIDALKAGGSLILDDSERRNYKKIFDFFAKNNFTKQDFIGIAPGQLRIKNTTIFTK